MEVFLLREWKAKALRDHDAAAYSVGQHWLQYLSAMPQNVVDYAVGLSWQRPIEMHHVPIPLPLGDCLRCVGISPSYVGDMPYIGFQEQSHRPVALAL